ncbi:MULTISPECIES: antibiotic biosynthesis monooxygenase [Cyanophyceae]|uniref:antibiotic biosynthesis monooxygenase n=1 Tax=Cyanophyceae TaxID=3028117 RepID=UPI0016826F5C|nr:MULTISPECIES: antibiotic biosynthesis monooxygenase [Cyanophyceae]MBD1918345.1 antibiotic biosynthesis monooxygenase [Phormidium sp. FACHB-77]MBD2028786.1 antibiotic biosynthesis monooxygenase [Phormidium sp. FACHB-322]MBD2051207.1 antibiotic biosynthesis monooxygenase [Leptolyngbya sp. FACHB-60]
MVQIDRTNTAIVGLDLYTVAERHQAALIEAIVQEQVKSWIDCSSFVSASVHRSLDNVRVFTYSQWHPKFDHRSLPRPAVFTEFFPPEVFLLEVTASRSQSAQVEIAKGDRVTHLAEFRMMPMHQPEMIKRTAAELDRAMSNSSSLLSATFHRSLDGTRMFNYGQWESQEAFEAILGQPGFNPEKPYWEGLARNEFHLYNVTYVASAS